MDVPVCQNHVEEHHLIAHNYYFDECVIFLCLNLTFINILNLNLN